MRRVIDPIVYVCLEYEGTPIRIADDEDIALARATDNTAWIDVKTGDQRVTLPGTWRPIRESQRVYLGQVCSEYYDEDKDDENPAAVYTLDSEQF